MRRQATNRAAAPAEYLTIQQLAEKFQVSVGCIRAWRLRGEGPPAIKLGNSLRWDSVEVNRWVDSQRESRWETD